MKTSSTAVMEHAGQHAPAPATKLFESEEKAAPNDGFVTRIGKDTIDGRQMDKYEIDHGDKGKGTMWVDPKNNLPLRMEAQDMKTSRIISSDRSQRNRSKFPRATK
jgi:outer membrane lipoprotein-sorting protein